MAASASRKRPRDASSESHVIPANQPLLINGHRWKVKKGCVACPCELNDDDLKHRILWKHIAVLKSDGQKQFRVFSADKKSRVIPEAIAKVFKQHAMHPDDPNPFVHARDEFKARVMLEAAVAQGTIAEGETALQQTRQCVFRAERLMDDFGMVQQRDPQLPLVARMRRAIQTLESTTQFEELLKPFPIDMWPTLYGLVYYWLLPQREGIAALYEEHERFAMQFASVFR